MGITSLPPQKAPYLVIFGAYLIAEVSYAITGLGAARVGIAAGGIVAAFILVKEISSSESKAFASAENSHAAAKVGKDGMWQCPKTHPLELRQISGKCDICRKFVCGATAGCASCGWDVCGDCHPLTAPSKPDVKVQITIQSMDAVVGDKKMDPFVEVRYAGSGSRTTAKRNAGRKAEWNETIGPFALVPGKALTCVVKDFDKAKGGGVKTEFVGSTQPLLVESLAKDEQGACECTLELLGAGGVGYCGQLQLTIQCVRSLDGLWSSSKGTLHAIVGGVCSDMHGHSGAFAAGGDRSCSLEFLGAAYKGTLSADSLSVEWRDKDVWSRVKLAKPQQ